MGSDVLSAIIRVVRIRGRIYQPLLFFCVCAMDGNAQQRVVDVEAELRALRAEKQALSRERARLRQLRKNEQRKHARLVRKARKLSKSVLLQLASEK